jgi:ubiquinone biosynthesis protein Coq4
LLVADRYVGQYPPIADLEKLPEGSLGCEYAKFLRKNSLTSYAEFSPKTPVREDSDYLKERARYIHDVAHVVLGLSTEIADEAALNAFLLAQIPSPISAVIVAGCILRTALTDPAALSPMLDKILDKWREGKRSKTLLSTRWEEHWHTPLGELRLALATRST